ncbi:Uncharacterised protein [Vibrio cholerae]|nr:Uncharacterised protein [Vibrio cholerae]
MEYTSPNSARDSLKPNVLAFAMLLLVVFKSICAADKPLRETYDMSNSPI